MCRDSELELLLRIFSPAIFLGSERLHTHIVLHIGLQVASPDPAEFDVVFMWNVDFWLHSWHHLY